MNNNWSHCLQEFFNSGKLAEKSYHQNSKIVVSLWKISRKIIPSGFQNFAEKPEDVTLEDVSATQQYEENLMYSERVKKQQVPKEDDRSPIPVLKLPTST